uniref:Uncharacterized protein n=1 Tax=Cacopsylla melanoneura TaxID=428564 RepID=A0A8D8QMI6_9HEMI
MSNSTIQPLPLNSSSSIYKLPMATATVIPTPHSINNKRTHSPAPLPTSIAVQQPQLHPSYAAYKHPMSATSGNAGMFSAQQQMKLNEEQQKHIALSQQQLRQQHQQASQQHQQQQSSQQSRGGPMSHHQQAQNNEYIQRNIMNWQQQQQQQQQQKPQHHQQQLQQHPIHQNHGLLALVNALFGTSTQPLGVNFEHLPPNADVNIKVIQPIYSRPRQTGYIIGSRPVPVQTIQPYSSYQALSYYGSYPRRLQDTAGNDQEEETVTI